MFDNRVGPSMLQYPAQFYVGLIPFSYCHPYIYILGQMQRARFTIFAYFECPFWDFLEEKWTFKKSPAPCIQFFVLNFYSDLLFNLPKNSFSKYKKKATWAPPRAIARGNALRVSSTDLLFLPFF
jgi:hypothetical protein